VAIIQLQLQLLSNATPPRCQLVWSCQSPHSSETWYHSNTLRKLACLSTLPYISSFLWYTLDGNWVVIAYPIQMRSLVCYQLSCCLRLETFQVWSSPGLSRISGPC